MAPQNPYHWRKTFLGSSNKFWNGRYNEMMNVFGIGEGWPDDYKKTFAKCQKAFSNIKKINIS